MSDSFGTLAALSGLRRGFRLLVFSSYIDWSSSPSVSVISDSNPDVFTRSSVVVSDEVDEMVLRELALFALVA